jgi:RHS repeat-associated protein
MWQQGSAPAPWGYTGEHWDANVGLLYLRARWYDPTVGRFTQADRIVPNPLNSQAWNRYAYGLNNPLRYTDPSGYCADGQDARPENIDQLIELIINLTPDAVDYWQAGELLPFSLGFGIDAFLQLVKDDELDLCSGQQMGRAIIAGIEGDIISTLTQGLSIKASLAAFGATLSSGPAAPWLPPAATICAYFGTYIPTNLALSFVAEVSNEKLFFVLFRLRPEDNTSWWCVIENLGK